ncbi:uncharacterized protein LOC135837404 [Planococcus citri]|uniref:uncharacterized protein LOC135837404 n=1 Tax=Planococcus citri TaxID=170843 RepID=UPI0031F8D5FA
MWAGYFVHSISTTCVIMLCITVVLNCLNLTLVSLSYNRAANKILSGDDFKMEKSLILFQTILSILAIKLVKQYTSTIMILLKFWTFGLTILTLLLDLIFTALITDDVLSKQKLEKVWKMKTCSGSCRMNTTPLNSFYHLASAVLFFYFVFKLSVTIIMVRLGGTFVKEIRQRVSSDVHLINDDDVDVEQHAPCGQTTPSAPPPSYDQCVMESAMPPPYSVIAEKIYNDERQKFESISSNLSK